MEDRVGTKSRLNFVKVCDDRSRTHKSYDLQTYAIDTVETLIGNVRIDSIDCCMQAIETIDRISIYFIDTVGCLNSNSDLYQKIQKKKDKYVRN